MFYTLYSIIHFTIFFAIIAFFFFLFFKIKKESGKWTAILVIVLFVMSIGFGSSNRENEYDDNLVLKSEIHDSLLIKANHHIDFVDYLGYNINLIHSVDIYIDESVEKVRIIKKEEHFNGFIPSGIEPDISYSYLTINDKGMLEYRFYGTISVRTLFGIKYNKLYEYFGEISIPTEERLRIKDSKILYP